MVAQPSAIFLKTGLSLGPLVSQKVTSPESDPLLLLDPPLPQAVSTRATPVAMAVTRVVRRIVAAVPSSWGPVSQ
ncbi:hypothetical protein GCM10017774_84350 [Lentzea cavernae]|uniref:Uncharacterized protein n=1 Tax=Lentzea cavernae TaxID=2020703 RepID=A0ABQ3MSY1_9PSEU|nr:hypothetical protein GCM10017774_84350 [Lentzea cavernae]